ncbi:MAG: class I SAM-dependent methyltransferase [Patescibacteria group bacterium]|mgnify:CR=1 FL=1
MQILYWPVNEKLKNEAEENYRTKFALGLKNTGHINIIRKLTFDGAAPNISVTDIENLFVFLEKKFIKKPLQGIGLEIGSGPAVFSAILAKQEKIKKMYAVEICQNIVELLMPKTVEQIAGDNSNKVVGCVGDFNNLGLPDKSVDFIFDFFSLHHSSDPFITLKECYRVLKNDGFILALDKARPDDLTQDDINKMLDKEYDDNYKKQFGIPFNQKLTRRMNGENEYRLKDWVDFFEQCGFKRFKHFHLAQCAGDFSLKLIKNILSLLPPHYQAHLSAVLPKQKNLFNISYKNRIFAPIINNFRKEMSLMIVYK